MIAFGILIAYNKNWCFNFIFNEMKYIISIFYYFLHLFCINPILMVSLSFHCVQLAFACILDFLFVTVYCWCSKNWFHSLLSCYILWLSWYLSLITLIEMLKNKRFNVKYTFILDKVNYYIVWDREWNKGWLI